MNGASGSRANRTTRVFTALIDSRRLLGPNFYSRSPGAVLEIAVDPAHSATITERWQRHARDIMDALGWTTHGIVVRPWPAGLGLFIEAPIDALLAATEVTEQALALAEGPEQLAPPSDDLLARLRVHVQHEARPRFRQLAAEAAAHAVGLTFDDDVVAVGSGTGVRTWPWSALPVTVDWDAVRDVPIALVTGSNGKTTTTRLLAAMLREAGYTVGHTSTDGVVVGGEMVAEGDYAGPAGARRVLHDVRVSAAVLETARGGMLRRGLAMTFADVAVVTRIAADHLGEYGITDQLDLGQAKLVVARALRPGRPVILNADDNTLVALSRRIETPIHWFSLDTANPVIRAHVLAGGDATVADGEHLITVSRGAETQLAAIADVPITLRGAAQHNVANALAASAAATALGVTHADITRALHTFGASATDNPGRLQVRDVGGATVIVDFVHNPDGWYAILAMVRRLRTGRLIVTLGQAGDRDDVALNDLAAAVWAGRPDLIILKEMEEYLRGRPYGQVSGVLAASLTEAGTPADCLRTAPTEVEAAQMALRAAQSGDVVVIAAHSHYDEIMRLLPTQPLTA